MKLTSSGPSIIWLTQGQGKNFTVDARKGECESMYIEALAKFIALVAKVECKKFLSFLLFPSTITTHRACTHTHMHAHTHTYMHTDTYTCTHKYTH